MRNVEEVLFIGLPGPYHNYSGLAPGNLAAEKNQGKTSSPRAAALQTLELARTLYEAGLKVAIIPPQTRPETQDMFDILSHRARAGNSQDVLQNLEAIRGNPDAIIAYAAQHDSQLLKQMSSSASMWTANAGTVAPFVDTTTGVTYITPANLLYHLHRAVEAPQTTSTLRAIFAPAASIQVAEPLPAHMRFSDEGAANHIRFTPQHADKGLHVFVYGRDDAQPLKARPKEKPARQNLEASQELVRTHNIPPEQVLFIQQNPEAIDHGIFHNDVISVGNENVFLYHEKAFLNGDADIEKIRKAYEALHPGEELILVPVSEDELSLDEVAATYFFNSQLVTLPDGSMMIIAPEQAQTNAHAAQKLKQIVAANSNPIGAVKFLDLKQSMDNGGGPACLRLRVPMTIDEIATLEQNRNVMVTPEFLDALEDFISDRYRDRLDPRDLADPRFHEEGRNVVQDILDFMQLKTAHERGTSLIAALD